VAQDPQPARTVLPIPERSHVGLTTYDAKDPHTAFPPIEAIRPPDGAPNVLLVMIDDCGFGASSAFGGPCNTPNIEKLAANGLKFNPRSPRRRPDTTRSDRSRPRRSRRRCC
jgi:hypothetical protein